MSELAEFANDECQNWLNSMGAGAGRGRRALLPKEG